MITLRTSLGSPFGRKARIAAIHLGLEARVAILPSQSSDPADPIHALNPLHKVPVLVTADGAAIYDSPVILEYLDWLAGGGRIVPNEPVARFTALTLQALGDGMADAFVLVRYESRWRAPEQCSQSWLAHQRKKIDDALSALDRRPPLDAGLDVGQIAVACALGFYDRAVGPDWRRTYASLSAWFDDFAAREPAFAATQP